MFAIIGIAFAKFVYIQTILAEYGKQKQTQFS